MAEDVMALPTDSEVAVQPGTDERAAPIGLFQKKDDELVAQIRLWWKESADAQSNVRKARDNEWANLAGHQWDEDDLKAFSAAKRPALTINLLQAMLAAVEGQERNNRQELKLYGEEETDDSPAFALNRLVKWCMYQCGGEFNLSRQFRGGCAVGEGWIGFEVDYFEDPEGTIRIVHVEEDECYPDPLSKEPAGRDMRYFHRVRMYGADEMEARWPGSTTKLKNQMLTTTTGVETDGKGFRDVYLTPNTTTGPKFYDAALKQWAVLETWWSQIEPGVVVVDEVTKLLVEKTPEEFEAMKAQRKAEQIDYRNKLADGTLANEQMAAHSDALMAAGAMPGQPLPDVPIPPMPEMPKPLDSTTRPVRRIYQAFSSFETLLSKEECVLPTVKRLPYVPFRAMWDKKKGEWFGLLRALLDMQKQHNVEQSAMVQLVQLMPKSSWMAPKGSFHNRQEWEKKIATPGAMLEYNARMGKPEQIKTPDIPRHLAEMAMSRPQAMREISGVNVELSGVRQGSDPGVVMEQRSKAALTVLAPIFDNYRESKIEIGKILLAYIQKYVSVGRRIRVLGPEGAKYVEMTMDMSIGRYDVIVEETNSTVTDRIASLNVLQTTLPQMMKAGVPIAPEMLDLLPMNPDVRTAQKRLVSWSLLKNGDLPPPDWQPGMPLPLPPMPVLPGGAPAEGSPPLAPQG